MKVMSHFRSHSQKSQVDSKAAVDTLSTCSHLQVDIQRTLSTGIIQEDGGQLGASVQTERVC